MARKAPDTGEEGSRFYREEILRRAVPEQAVSEKIQEAEENQGAAKAAAPQDEPYWLTVFYMILGLAIWGAIGAVIYLALSR